jgi:hypothetical protein
MPNIQAGGPCDGEEDLADDFLHGVRQIAQFTGDKERRVYYLLERGLIPAGKLGDTWVASKRALRAHYARLVGGAR